MEMEVSGSGPQKIADQMVSEHMSIREAKECAALAGLVIDFVLDGHDPSDDCCILNGIVAVTDGTWVIRAFYVEDPYGHV